MKPLLQRLLALLITIPLLLASLPARADYPIEVIRLTSRPLEEVLPLVRPLIGTDGSVSGMGDHLVVKASPERIHEIRKLLLELDRPPRRLLITVSKQAERASSVSGYSADADIRVGNGQFGINPRGHAGDGTRARVRIYDTDDGRVRTTGQRVQAVEGRPAFIASGTRIPVSAVERHYRYGYPHERRVTQLQDASSGFYVVPRVSGEYVTLDIQQFDDRPGRRRGVIDTQSATTVVRGRLGEWISLGGIDTAGQTHRGGPGRSISTRESVDQQIEVMVECLDCADSDGYRRSPGPQADGPESNPRSGVR